MSYFFLTFLSFTLDLSGGGHFASIMLIEKYLGVGAHHLAALGTFCM